MRIKTKYVVVLIFVGALVAAVPGINGYYFKNHYLKLIEAHGGGVGKLKVTDYQLGWLSSTAELTMDFNDPDAKTPDPTKVIAFEQQITHGPFLQDPDNGGWVVAQAAMQTQVHLDKKIESMLGVNTADGIMQVSTVVSFADHYANQVKTPLFNFKNDDKGTITWQGMTGMVDVDFVSEQLKHVKTDVALGQLSIQGPTMTLTMPSMAAQAEKNCQAAIMCTGTSSLAVPSISGAQESKTVKLAGLTTKTTYGVGAGNDYHADLDVMLNKLDVPDYSFGPISLKFSAANLNATELKKMIDISKRIAAAPAAELQAQQLVALAEYNKILPNVIMAATVLHEDAKIDTSYGRFTSTAKFYWPANTPLPANSSDLSKMNFNMDVHAATTLVDQVIAVLDGTTAKPKSVSDVVTPVVPEKPAAPTAEETIHALLDPLTNDKKMSDDAVKAIIDLHKKHLLPAIYDAAIEKIMFAQRLPMATEKEITKKLQDQYAGSYTENDITADVTTATPASAVTDKTPPAQPSNASGQAQAQLDAMIKQGYVRQDKDNYVVSIVYENGTMKVNGVVVPLSTQATTTTSS